MNFTAGIYIEEKTKYFPIVTISGALVNIAVNLTLIPSYGIMGAAWATFASYFVMAVGLFIVSQKFYRIDYEYSKIFSVFVIIAVTAFILYSYSDVMNIGTKAIVFVGFVVSFFLFRVVKKEEVKRTIKSFRKGKA